MDIRLLLAFLVVATPMLSPPSSSLARAHADLDSSNTTVQSVESAGGASTETCNEEEEEMMGTDYVVRRTLSQRINYISYGALRRNNVPCNRPGNSYYNCARSGRANPYRRGCSVITRCHRYTI